MCGARLFDKYVESIDLGRRDSIQYVSHRCSARRYAVAAVMRSSLRAAFPAILGFLMGGTKTSYKATFEQPE